MRNIGSLLIFLIVTWIGLGFLLSDNFNTHQALTHIQQQVDQAVKDRNAMQEQLNQANSELSAAKDQKDQLARQNMTLQEQVKQLQNNIQVMEKQNTDLQSQFDKAKKLNSLTELFAGIPYHSLMLAIFVPILPLSLYVTIVGYQSGKHRISQKHSLDNKSEHNMSIHVTQEEMRQIAKTRRGRN